MFTKMSVLVPTRKRPERLRRMLESFESTTDGAAELVFRVDEDDPESLEMLRAYSTVVGPRGKGYSDMSSFFNGMLPAVTGDVLMCGNDDMVFKTPGWPSLMLEAASRFPDGLFDIGVSTYNEDHYPFWTVSRMVVDRVGFVLDPEIFWGDIFWRDVMGVFGRCFKLPSVVIEHDWVGHAPDQTFIEADQNNIYHRDPTYWTGTHARAVHRTVEKLKGLAA